MQCIQSYLTKFAGIKLNDAGKYPDLFKKFEIDINRIDLEDSKTIQTTFT